MSVDRNEDWLAIAKLGGPVVDPMILRCGELFLQGAAGVRDRNATWDLLSRNIHALGTFFDRIVMDEQIPVFNYAETFAHDTNFATRALGQVNSTDEILVDVKVGYEEYATVKSGALDELRKIYEDGGRAVDPADAHNILGELGSSQYAWYPQLGGLQLRDKQEEQLAAYILGGLVFGAYAQLAGTDHLMQPKRSRLFLAISLKEKSSRTLEEHLFKNLAELSGRTVAEVPYTPTFFALLLSKSDGPRAMLRNALDLRKSGEILDYRQWLRAALADFDTNGRIGIELERDVQKIEAAVRRKLAGTPALLQPEVKMTVADAVALKPPTLGVNLTAPAKALWGWVIESLPGKRHRKLLSRAIIADREYAALERLVDTTFKGPGFCAAM